MPIQGRQNRDAYLSVNSGTNSGTGEEMAKVKGVHSGVGLDCGTMNFVSARKTNNGVSTKRIRDAFLELDPSHKRMLKISNTSYIELDGHLLVIGDDALQCANMFNQEARRPMSGGVMNSSELDAQQVISLMMKEILGEPLVENEKCFYSVPAPAIDIPGSDITYHKAILGKILSELGYDPEPSNEAQAIIFSECANDMFSGIGVSYGSGMTNVSLNFNAMPALEFSIGKGGDWIDAGAASAVGSTRGKMCSLKESGIDISNPQGREQEAIALFVRTLIDDSLKGIVDKFAIAKKDILIPKPIPIIVSGGTSQAGGFLDLFKQRFDVMRSKFPIQISEIRQAENPMNAVATGLLVLSQLDD